MVGTTELDGMLKVVAIKFEVPFWHLPGRTEQTVENVRPGQDSEWVLFEYKS
jgi:hypothetical protein